MPRLSRAVRRLVLALSASGVAATVVAAQGQSQRPPTFRSLSDLVQVDVVAVDQDGNAVRGLKAEDFTLIDRKKPQKIAAFEEVTHERLTQGEAAVVPAVPGLKRDVANNQSAQSDRLVVIVIDDLHIFKNRTDRTKDIARTVVNDLGPRASMAVLFTSGEHSIEVTDDRSELTAAIDQLRARRPFPRPILAYDNLHGQSPDPAIGLAEFYDDMNTYKTMQDASRMLGAGDGRRKAFVFISEGIGKDLSGIFGAMAAPGDVPEGGEAYAATGDASATIVPDAVAYHSWALIDMMDAMRRSNVATYAIDPRGAVSSKDLMRECHPAIGYLEDPCLGGGLPAWNSWVRQAQHGLELTAQASGGFAITNTDDFTGGLKRIIEDLDHYYLLGFYPEDTKGKGYRQLDVQVNRPGVTLRFRHGYDPSGPPASPKNENPLVALSAGVMPRTELPLRLTATPLMPTSPQPVKPQEIRVAVSLEVTAPARDFVGANGSAGELLSYSVLAANVKTGKIVKQYSNNAQLTAKGRPPGSDWVAFLLPVTLTLPPGRYQLRASATSGALATGGSVYLAIEVPDYTKAAPFGMSGLVVGYADGARVATVAEAVGGASGALPLAPTLDREFDSSDTLRVYCEIARKIGGPAAATSVVHTRVEIVDLADRVVKTLDTAPPDDHGRVDLNVPLSGVPAGTYRLRVTVQDGSSHVSRELAIIVG